MSGVFAFLLHVLLFMHKIVNCNFAQLTCCSSLTCVVCAKVQACSLTHAWMCALDPDALGFGCVKVKRRYAELAVQRYEHSATTVGASEGGQSKDAEGDTSFRLQNQRDSNLFMTPR